MQLALFDFDGTLSSRDSLLHFLMYSFKAQKLLLAGIILSPYLLAYRAGLLSRQTAKEKVYYYFFYNWPLEKFQQLANDYAEQHLNKIIRPQALEKLYWHQAQGHRVIVVSASIENYLAPWCQLHNCEYLGTRLSLDDNQRLKGSFSSSNCYGPEKAKRIQALLTLSDYQRIYAYGDSKGDREMLSLADEVHYKPFR
jgi:phosphatidylglycerophosphatase C